MLTQQWGAMWSDPDLEGVLEKQSRRNGDWKPRYFALKGSNLFWFSSPSSRSPKGLVPLEGASVRTVHGPGHHDSTHGGPPIMFGIVVLLDQAFAASPGGRPDLILGASSPELQALWAKALQASSISRPQLLAKLHQKSRDQHVYPDAGLTRSLSDNGAYADPPTARGRDSFAFPTTGGGMPNPASPPAREARLSQFNVQQLQRQIESDHTTKRSATASATSMLDGDDREAAYAQAHVRSSRSPHRSRPRSATPPRSPRAPTATGAASTLSGPASPYGQAHSHQPPSLYDPAYTTISSPCYAFPGPGAAGHPGGVPGGGGGRAGGKDQGRYPLRQMVRNFTDKMIGRITPERRRGGTPERMRVGGGYEDPAVFGGYCASPVGGHLAYNNAWAGEEEAVASPRHSPHGCRTTPRSARSLSPSPRGSPRGTHSYGYDGYDRYGGSGGDRYAGEWERASEYEHGGVVTAKTGHAASPRSGNMPGSPAASTVAGLPLKRVPPSPSSTHSSAAPAHSPHHRLQPGTPRHAPSASPHALSGASTPTHSHKQVQTRRQASPSASTVASVPCSVQHEDLDQLSSRLRKAFMGATSQGGQAGGGHVREVHASKGSEWGGDSCDESMGEGERGLPPHASKHGQGAGRGVHAACLEPQQQSELAAVQQQVAMAAQLLRAQADRLQGALGNCDLASLQQLQQQPSGSSPEITPSGHTTPLPSAAINHPPTASGACTPGSAISSHTASQQPRGSGQGASEVEPSIDDGGSIGTPGARRRANTLFFMNHFQSLQASLAEVAAAAASALRQQEQQQQQQQQGQRGGAQSAAVKPQMHEMHEPLQHYLNSVQQQLHQLQAHRARLEHDESASLGSAMEAVQNALSALNGQVNGLGAVGARSSGFQAPAKGSTEGRSTQFGLQPVGEEEGEGGGGGFEFGSRPSQSFGPGCMPVGSGRVTPPRMGSGSSSTDARISEHAHMSGSMGGGQWVCGRAVLAAWRVEHNLKGAACVALLGVCPHGRLAAELKAWGGTDLVGGLRGQPAWQSSRAWCVPAVWGAPPLLHQMCSLPVPPANLRRWAAPDQGLLAGWPETTVHGTPLL